MGLFDEIKLDHPMFGEDRGHIGQSKDFDDPFMEDYEITPEGRLLHIDVTYEDRSDPNAKPGSWESLSGSMTPVPTGTKTDQNWHGYIWVWGNGDYEWRCKFTDGVLVEAVKVPI